MVTNVVFFLENTSIDCDMNGYVCLPFGLGA